MKKYDPNQPLISIHIPKAGGTSFRRVLQQWYGDRLFFHYFNEPQKTMPEKYKLLPGNCIHGHFNSSRGFGVMHYYPDAKQFITFLRDPFEILVSRYYYVKKREKAGISFHDGKPTALADNINDFLEEEIFIANYSPNILNFFPELLTKDNYKEILEKYFIFIGFICDYQSSINQLAKLLGFSPLIAPLENKSDRFGEVDPSLRKTFIDGHPLEYAVYNHALSLFPLISSPNENE